MLTSALPMLIIGGLLYAGLFVKPESKGAPVPRPVFERGDHFFGVAFHEGGALWLVGSNGKILKSEDNGANWVPQRSPTEQTLQDVATWDGMRTVAIGNAGVIAVTNDGGRSWHSIEAPRSKIANKLLRVRTLQDGQGWAVGEGASILHTADYGETWTRVASAEDNAWNDIFFRGSHGWIVGEFGKARMTTDQGATWKEMAMPVKSSLMSVVFRDDSNGIAVGLNGAVLTSADGGSTWLERKSGTQEHLYASLWDGTRWLAAGAKGVILVGNADGSTWQPTRLDPNDRNWYTAVAHDGKRYFLAGSRFVATSALPR
jgi:photosystem II stability/assembly factor-like uncharacterized protein